MPSIDTKVRLRKNVPQLNNTYRYKFDELKIAGDSFVISGKVNYASIRTQASKQGKRRGVVYQVSKTKKDRVIVRLDHVLQP